MYPTLQAYKAGNLTVLWNQETNELLESDQTLSSNRAGEVAAAKIAAMAGQEYAELEKWTRDIATSEIARDMYTHGLLTTEEIELYDWLADNDAIKQDLIDLSGTRTLLTDMEV